MTKPTTESPKVDEESEALEELAKELESQGQPEQAHGARFSLQWKKLVTDMPAWARRIVGYQLQQNQELMARVLQLENEAEYPEGLDPDPYSPTPEALSERLPNYFGVATFLPQDPLWVQVRSLVTGKDIPIRIDLMRAPEESTTLNPMWHLAHINSTGGVMWGLIGHDQIQELFDPKS